VTRDIITQNELFEIVRSTDRELQYTLDFDRGSIEDFDPITKGREEIANTIYVTSFPVLHQYGMELIDVQIKRINYIDEVRRQVYARMISERQKVAERFRSQGQGRAAEIMGRIQRTLNEIESEAFLEAQRIMGEADAEAVRIYAHAFNRDPEFYRFIRTLELYRNTIGESSTLILTTDSDLFRFLKRAN
jgi:membrane protease subunit HflC